MARARGSRASKEGIASVTRARKIGRPAVLSPASSQCGAAWSAVRAAIIIIFTSPRVIKAARYTCSVRGHPLPTARTTPLAGVVGVVAARGRVGHSREGAQRRNGERRAFGVPAGWLAWMTRRGDRRWNRDGTRSWRARCGGVRVGTGAARARHARRARGAAREGAEGRAEEAA